MRPTLSAGTLALASGLLFAAPAHPQPAIVVDEPVLVTTDRSTIPHVEPHLAAHPRESDLLVGAAITWPGEDPRQGLDASIVAAFRSADGGRTWARTDLPACQVDPWVAFGGDRRVFVACLGYDPSRVVVYRSEDRAETWSEPINIPLGGGGGPDHPIIAVGRSEQQEDVVYVAFGQSFDAIGLRGTLFGPAVSVSVDGGEHFATPVFIRHDNLEKQPIDLLVLPDGKVAILFMDYATPQAPLAHRRTWLIVSDDRGSSFSTAALVLEQTGSEMPWAAAVDASPRHQGRVYVVVDGSWQRDRRGATTEPRGKKADLFVVASSDGGESWARPIRVTDSPPGADEQTPAIAVNRDGVVGVAWYDTRHSRGGGCFDLYFSASVDGGRSFLPEARVTPETSCPQSVERQHGIAERWPFGGDYSGLAASADGRFHVFWADSRTGIYQLWSAGVEVAADRSLPAEDGELGEGP